MPSRRAVADAANDKAPRATPNRTRGATRDVARGATRDVARGATRAAILGAARGEFAAKGLTGARVAAIAARAGVNKQLLYYYFGSKDDLYRAALEAVYVEIRSREQELRLAGLPPLEAMAALIGFSFDYLAEHPDFIGMLNHENARGAQHVRTSATIRATNSPLVALLRATLSRGAKVGVFRSGIDPVDLYVSIAGMAYFFFSNRLTLSSIFDRDLESPRRLASYRRHVLALALAGLRP